MSENLAFVNTPVLVTGGAGVIGSNLVRALLGLGAHVIVLDNLSSGTVRNLPSHARLLFIQGSVVDDDSLAEACPQDVRYVFHLAALFANQNSVEHPFEDLLTNGGGAVKVLERARGLSELRRVVIVSSSCVYGPCDGVVTEETPVHPGTPYAISKLMSEYYAHYYHRLYSLPVVILRYFNAYGPGERPGRYRNVIPNFLKLAMDGQPLPITGTGDETRTFTYVEDIVDGTLKAAIHESAIGETFNLGSSYEIRILELAERVNALVGNPSGVQFAPRRPWDRISRRAVSVDKERALLGYEPKVDLDEGLRGTYAWLQELRARGEI